MTLETQTLSRIMLLQNMLSHLGDQDSIVSFVCRGLEEVSGVTTATYLPDKPSHLSDLKTVYFPLQFNKNHYGEICLSLSNTDEFKPYQAYINNLCFMIAVILEERRQGQLNRQHRQHLEILINERTKALQEEVQERRIAEELALKEKQRAELYLDISEAMIVELDKQGKICAINKRGCEILGYKQSVLLGQSWIKLCIPSHVQPITQNTFDQLMAGQERCNEYIENEIISSDCKTHYIAWHNMLQFDDEGKIASVLSSGIDITERKQMEVEREKLITQLQDKTAEQERFIYTVSHDLKSPLVTIGGFCGVAEEDLASGNQEQCKSSLDIISNAAKRMGQLLNELLHISRIGFKIDPSEIVSLEVLIKEASESVSGVISENKTTIEIEPELPDVLVDRQYILQVLENLISNASTYSRSANGGSHVKIGVTRNSEELIGYVKDNGIGVEAQYLEKIFGLFEKLDAKSDSTGVGLAIVKRIIENHGGRIWAKSEGLGQGTTFFFTLPEAKQ